jgi:hypothetical protein
MSTILSTTFGATVTINGTTYAVSNNESITLTGEDAVLQTVNVPTSETTLANLGAVGPASLTDLSYLVVINRDGTNFVRLRLSDTGGATMDVKLSPGKAFVFNSRELSVSATEGAFASFSNIDNIKAQADTAACDVELLLAY